MINNNISFAVLIKGKPITEYRHNGRVYVEGRAGSAYELEVRNDNAFRVEVILSVDGLSVTDGEAAGPQSGGYVIDARSTLRIPGWKLDGQQAARFEFAGKGKSYAAHASGSARNTGIIGLLAYRERQKPAYRGFTAGIAKSVLRGAPLGQPGTAVDPYISGGAVWTSTAEDLRSYHASSRMTFAAEPVDHRIGICAASVGAMATLSTSDLSRGYNRNQDTLSASAQAMNAAEVKTVNVVQQVLGTGFGAATEFSTTEVAFERADMIAQTVIYYDEARSLARRGIQVGRRHQQFADEPDAFPAMRKGCTPPPGWKG